MFESWYRSSRNVPARIGAWHRSAIRRLKNSNFSPSVLKIKRCIVLRQLVSSLLRDSNILPFADTGWALSPLVC
ncbi:hypothetical protein CHUAL_002861 [Chamberlinius hualienensis]